MRCCKQPKARRVLKEGKCAFRETCSDFCLKTDDCLPPERCDTSRFYCTTKCSNDTDCHHGYICENDHCVSNETNDNDDSGLVLLVVFSPFILYGLCNICVILCYVHILLKSCLERLHSSQPAHLNHRGRNCTAGSLNGNPPTSTSAPQQNNEMLELNPARIPVDTSVQCTSMQEINHLLRLPVDTSYSLYLNGQQNAETLEMDSI